MMSRTTSSASIGDFTDVTFVRREAQHEQKIIIIAYFAFDLYFALDVAIGQAIQNLNKQTKPTNQTNIMHRSDESNERSSKNRSRCVITLPRNVPTLGAPPSSNRCNRPSIKCVTRTNSYAKVFLFKVNRAEQKDLRWNPMTVHDCKTTILKK